MSGNWKLETWRELDDRTVWMLHDEGYATSIEGPDEDGDLRIEVEEKGYGTVHTYVPAIEVAALLRKIGWTVTAPANQTPGAPRPRDIVEALERGEIPLRDITLECTRCRRTMPGDQFRDHDCGPGGAAPAHSWAAFLDGPDGCWGLCDLSDWGRGHLHARTKDCLRWRPALHSPAKETDR